MAKMLFCRAIVIYLSLLWVTIVFYRGADIMVQTTTIQVSSKLKSALDKRKIVEAESYEEIIWGLLEDNLALSEETKAEIARAEADLKAGRYKTIGQVREELGI